MLLLPTYLLLIDLLSDEEKHPIAWLLRSKLDLVPVRFDLLLVLTTLCLQSSGESCYSSLPISLLGPDCRFTIRCPLASVCQRDIYFIFKYLRPCHPRLYVRASKSIRADLKQAINLQSQEISKNYFYLPAR